MNIGNLYKVKKWFWLLFPTKETTAAANDFIGHYGVAHDITIVVAAASYLSNRLKCEVTYFSSGSYVVFLEEDGKFKRVLTSDGKIGWIWVHENYNDRFEEVKSE